jgi:hypothetical protein
MNLDKFATDQILPNVRKELEEHGDMRDGCLCFTGFSPSGRPSFAIVNNASAPPYYEKVSALARFVKASKVLSVSDTATTTFPDRDKAIVIRLILPDGSVEWTIAQTYRKNGKQFAWDEPERIDGGSQRFLPAWGSLAKTK